VHNNYLTLPVVFVMMSPHYAFTYAHEYNWLVLFVIFAIGALIRHFFNLRNQGRRAVMVPFAAVALGVFLVTALAPRGGGTASGAVAANQAVSFAEVNRIIHARCVPCHSRPTHPIAPVTAAGCSRYSRDIKVWSPRIFDRVVVTRRCHSRPDADDG
jgi:uncharacterized membrane protein